MTQRTSRIIASCGLLLMLLTATIPMLHAQAVAIATVNGRLVDPLGAVVPNASVKLTATDTGSLHQTTTNQDGLYTIVNLPVGPYKLEVSAPGFQTYVQSGIVLRVNDNVELDATLTVGEVNERVEVQANISMVQTQQNTISQVIDGRRIAEMPLNGRDPTQLITISGAAVNHSDGTNTGSKSFYSSQSISIAGGLGNQTNYLLDGGDNNDSFTNVNLPFPFPDALAEFSVETSSLPARNGLHPGGLVNAVTKSGTNQWHGNFFEFVRNGDVNAQNYFATKNDSLKRNQFGGTVGGKIITDKLFFFFGFQQSNIRQDPSSLNATIPTAAALLGDFTALDGGACGAARPNTVDISTTSAAYPNGTPLSALPNPYHVDPSKFDPAAVALAKYLPVGSANSCGLVQYGYPVHSNEQEYVARGDWTISPKQSLYGRYFIDMYKLAAFFNPTNILVTGISGNYEKAQTLTFGDSYMITPTIVNSLHFTFSRRRDDRGPADGVGINAQTIGVQNIYQGTPNYLQLTVQNGGFAVGSGSGALGTFNITSYQEADDVDILKGKHSIALGVDIIRTQDNQNNHYEDNGSFIFNGSISGQPVHTGDKTTAGDSLLDFLEGNMNHYEQTMPQQNAIRQTVIGAYVQDTWHVTPKLVINAGLRWEPMKYPYDYFHRGSTFSRADFDAGKKSSVFVNAPAGSSFYGDPGVTPSFSDDRWTNFSPRLGLVYNPDGQGKSTFRIGAAMMYDSPGTFMNYRVIANNLPYGATIIEQGSKNGYKLSNPWGGAAANPFPLPSQPSKTTSFPAAASQVLTPRNIHSPIVYQWNLSFQHQFGRDWIFSLTYLGNEMNHSWIGNEINPGVYIPGNSTGLVGSCGALVVGLPAAGSACESASTQNRRVLSLANPTNGAGYSTQVIANDGANSNYNGMLTSLEHRFEHNYTVLANYTWSKCLQIGPLTTLGVEGVVSNPYNIKGDYGYCTIDAPNIFNLSVVANSTWHGGGITSFLLKDWQVAPLIRITSGLPVNLTSGVDNSGSGILLDRPDVVPGQPVYTRNPTHTKAAGLQYLNRAAFTNNAPGTFGTVRHNSIRPPKYVDVDLAVVRSFHVRERYGLQLRVEGFNIFNHPNFFNPASGSFNGSLAASTFGSIKTANDPRILQGAIKISF
ncbi:carboxypeptidase regulatory-like domain-containing protein [Granulicella sp. WH15]|uniref:TonB-dependent receptor n=1 Tax=Granulicella sp. WH15 TaxID=2602070 RepID=UPI001367008E|nr:TonB-dependent receptor [Granulicella sp. WH15]QHN03279.1 carboxypeptidase regulatory-like domain-containing protein [Granulicella sp. WH15]